MITITVTKPFDKEFLIAQIQDFYRISSRDWVTENADGSLVLSLPDDRVQQLIDSHKASYVERTQIVQIAQSAVGIALTDLTAAQIKAILAFMLYKLGGVDPQTLKVRDLSSWY